MGHVYRSAANQLLACCVTSSILVGCLSAVVEAYTIVYITTPTPPDYLTCWTCPDKTTNDECNQWAPDVFCPLNHTVCRSVHQFEMSTLRSVSVMKQCTLAELCTKDHVGCHLHPLHNHIMECVTCCNQDYCNEPVAHNASTALSLSVLTTPRSSATSVTTTTTTAAATHRYIATLAPCVVWTVLQTQHAQNTVYSAIYITGVVLLVVFGCWSVFVMLAQSILVVGLCATLCLCLTPRLRQLPLVDCCCIYNIKNTALVQHIRQIMLVHHEKLQCVTRVTRQCLSSATSLFLNTKSLVLRFVARYVSRTKACVYVGENR